jgi:hypothetical protein
MDTAALRKYIFLTLALSESENMNKPTLFAAGFEEDMEVR